MRESFSEFNIKERGYRFQVDSSKYIIFTSEVSFTDWFYNGVVFGRILSGDMVVVS
ncbi:hypothetical protein EZS27_014231 [termite gut metagenome]|uniref:Uncharacterized protein n=1 Tax=termite gut metagenome TaxID=433724 RepID=A0A5J4RXE1_9ZZZZ